MRSCLLQAHQTGLPSVVTYVFRRRSRSVLRNSYVRHVPPNLRNSLERVRVQNSTQVVGQQSAATVGISFVLDVSPYPTAAACDDRVPFVTTLRGGLWLPWPSDGCPAAVSGTRALHSPSDIRNIPVVFGWLHVEDFPAMCDGFVFPQLRGPRRRTRFRVNPTSSTKPNSRHEVNVVESLIEGQ